MIQGSQREPPPLLQEQQTRKSYLWFWPIGGPICYEPGHHKHLLHHKSSYFLNGCICHWKATLGHLPTHQTTSLTLRQLIHCSEIQKEGDHFEWWQLSVWLGHCDGTSLQSMGDGYLLSSVAWGLLLQALSIPERLPRKTNTATLAKFIKEECQSGTGSARKLCKYSWWSSFDAESVM